MRVLYQFEIAYEYHYTITIFNGVRLLGSFVCLGCELVLGLYKSRSINFTSL